ncbi:MAG TPA: hypothetical protein DDY59_14675 [Lachnospiraceae bacterium]|jgi:hypothetical protein|nr:hypothetical protein [Lachnospiraceae bacterium]
MNQMPIKFRIVQVIYQNKNVSNQEILKILKNEYPCDRSINEQSVEECLLTLLTTSLIELTSTTLDNNSKLKTCYEITEYGKNLIRYLP